MPMITDKQNTFATQAIFGNACSWKWNVDLTHQVVFSHRRFLSDWSVRKLEICYRWFARYLLVGTRKIFALFFSDIESIVTSVCSCVFYVRFTYVFLFPRATVISYSSLSSYSSLLPIGHRHLLLNSNQFNFRQILSSCFFPIHLSKYP